MFKTKDFKTIFANIRFVYMLVYMLIMVAAYVIPVKRFADEYLGTVNIILAILGIALIGTDFVTRRIIFKAKYCTLLILFTASCAISCIYNLKYGFADNVKTLVWTCIHFFIFATVDTDLNSETTKKHFKIFSESFSLIWLVFSAISLGEFVVQYNPIWYLESIAYPIREGFHEGRLFGVFIDPNFASLISIIAICLCILNMGKTKFSKIYHIFAIVIQLFYVILSGSRTSLICLIVMTVLLSSYKVWTALDKAQKGKLLKTVSSIATATLAIFVVLLSENVIRESSNFISKSVTSKIHIEYKDEGSKNPNVNIDNPDNEISFERPDVVQSSDVSNGRISIWLDYLKVFTKSPILGTSPRNVLQFVDDHFDSLYINTRRYLPHNSYLGVLVCTGLLGTSIIGVWAILTFIQFVGYLFRNRKNQYEYYSTIFILTIIIIALAMGAFPLMFAFFSNTIIDVMLWVLIGYTKSLIRISEPEKYTKEPLAYRILSKLPSIKSN